MKRYIFIWIVCWSLVSFSAAQEFNYKGTTFDVSNVKASVVDLNGEEVIKVERDLNALPFSIDNLAATVDEPTFVRVKDLNMEDGTVEVKVLSRILKDTPFPASQGFIGIAFRVNKHNTAYESIYLRPKIARSEDQLPRNHSVQYYAYPDYKFDKLRRPEYNGIYETYADMGLDEWITMRIQFEGKKARLYLNDQKLPSFIVNDMKSSSAAGTIGLWVDIGTEGYFKDLKIINNSK
jgi:hypothetical protein